MIPPDKAGRLLDEVVYERVLSFVDLPSLTEFQHELEFALVEVGVEYDEIARVAREMIDNALHRMADDEARCVSFGGAFDDCELCEQEARQRAPAAPR